MGKLNMSNFYSFKLLHSDIVISSETLYNQKSNI